MPQLPLFQYQPLTEPIQFNAVPIDWAVQFTNPVRRILLRQQDYAVFVFAPTGETIFEDKWHAAWSEPVRRKGLAAHFQQSSALQPPSVDIAWFAPFSDPVRIKQGLRGALQDVSADDPNPKPPSIGWFNWLAEPRWFKKPLPTPALQVQPELPQPNPTSTIEWFNPFSEPQRKRQPQTQQFIADAIYKPVEATIGWFNWLSEPRWFKKQPTFAQQVEPELSQPNPTATIEWWTQFSEPQRRRQPLTQQYVADAIYPPNAVSIEWFLGLSEPRRGRQPIVQYFIADGILQTDISWFAALTDPVRLKPGLKVNLQDPTIEGFAPIVTQGWFNNLADPVRAKGMRTSLQSTTADNYNPVTPTISFDYFVAWSDPKRIKQWQHLYPNTTNSWTTSLVTNIAWFMGLSEPKREKIGLKAQLQQFLSVTLTPPIPTMATWFRELSTPLRAKLNRVLLEQIYPIIRGDTPVIYTARMDVTEQGDFLTAVCRQFNVATHAYVDIIEKDPRDRGNLGIIENIEQSSIVTAIVEPQSVPTGGSAVTTVAGARVAIILT